MMRRRINIVLLGCLLTGFLHAQTFEVRSFKLLENDISAYIDPVRDLNEEACALVKVVCDKDFVFSTPLGIVLRQEKVGEIWIYLPKGSRKMTIKHPRWGVLRDYSFDQKLESRMTYELVLAPPVNREPATEQTMRVRQKPRPPVMTIQAKPATLPMPDKRRPKAPLTYLAMANVSVHDSDISMGGTFGVMRMHGVYIRGLSNFRTLSTGGREADKEGVLLGGETKPYYTGASSCARVSLTAGGVHRLSRSFYLYEGIGYGTRTLAWETIDGAQVKINDYSYQGISGEVGGMWKYRSWVASLGVLTVKTSYWEMVCGVGFIF